MSSPTTGRVIPAGTGQILLDGPVGAVLLAGPDRTAGGASFLVHPLAPRALGAPVHIHSTEDEWSYVLTGAVGVEIGGITSVARPGDLVCKPRGVPHAFWNAGDEPASLLEVITPGGFEAYFADLAALFAASPVPTPAELGAVAASHGLQVDGASIGRLAQAHGLVLA